MSLERPLLALVVAALALVLLAILERLRRQPVVLVVASLELFPDDDAVTSAAQRSRRREWRDLVLRALAALAFAFALGGPSVEAGERAGRRARIVLGRGASLAAREPSGQTRLELARAEVDRALARLAPEDRVDVTLLPSGPDAIPPGLTPAEARRAVANVVAVAAPGELEGDLAALAAAASDLARDGRSPDEAGHTLPALVVLDREPRAGAVPRELLAAARFALVGSPLPNQSVVALASRRDEAGRERLLCAVSNFSDSQTHVDVELKLAASEEALARATPLVRPLELGPNETRTILIDDTKLLAATNAVESRLALARRVEVRPVEARPAETLEVDGDALALDDRVLALRSVLAPVRVAIVGDLGRPVETALRSCEQVSVELFAQGQAPARGFDLSVVRVERDEEPAPLGACVFVYPPANRGLVGAGVAPGKLRLAPRARTLVPSASDLEASGGVDLAASLAHLKSVRPTLPGNLGELESVVESAETPPTRVVAASPTQRAGSLTVYLGFDTRAPEVEEFWAHDASFPRFWAELVERVRERPDEPPALGVEPTGRALLLPRPVDATAQAWLDVIAPGSMTGSAPGSAPQALPQARGVRGGHFTPLMAGLHRVRAEGARGEALFSAALLDARTSDLRSAKSVRWSDDTLALLDQRDTRGQRGSLAGVLALVGLLLAATSWLLAGYKSTAPVPARRPA